MKRGKKYAIGQKIPSFVKPFSKQEVSNKEFTSSHSSILRILTKWAEYMEDILRSPRTLLESKLYAFKDFENRFWPPCLSGMVKETLT